MKRETEGADQTYKERTETREGSMYEEVLEALWIKPDDINLQWKIDQLKREEDSAAERKLKT